MLLNDFPYIRLAPLVDGPPVIDKPLLGTMAKIRHKRLAGFHFGNSLQPCLETYKFASRVHDPDLIPEIWVCFVTVSWRLKSAFCRYNAALASLIRHGRDNIYGVHDLLHGKAAQRAAGGWWETGLETGYSLIPR